MEIKARNVNDAVAQAIPYLIDKGEREDSRNGTVLVAPEPVITIYDKSTERVLFGATRDANPFFHLMESLWMLAGDCDVAFPAYFNKRFMEYSDDGQTVHGAYGYRWRNFFMMDQLALIVEELKDKPNSRRAVLQMWSAQGDLCAMRARSPEGEILGTVGGLNSKDVPCNTAAYFDIRYGRLNMTVLNRSNDIIWGAYGANAVHFSVLQEYLAAWLRVPVGTYRQFSNNFHAYTDVYDLNKLHRIANEAAQDNFYLTPTHPTPHDWPVVKPYPLISSGVKAWNEDLYAFMNDPLGVAIFNDPFFNGVAQPMYAAWKERKDKQGDGLMYIEQIVAEDWRLACVQWVTRREKKH